MFIGAEQTQISKEQANHKGKKRHYGTENGPSHKVEEIFVLIIAQFAANAPKSAELEEIGAKVTSIFCQAD